MIPANLIPRMMRIKVAPRRIGRMLTVRIPHPRCRKEAWKGKAIGLRSREQERKFEHEIHRVNGTRYFVESSR